MRVLPQTNASERYSERPCHFAISVQRLSARLSPVTEVAANHARAAVGALARLDGWPVVLLGTDGRFDGGGLSAEAADKIVRLIDLADTFHLPVVAFMDHPGMLIGLQAERAGALRAVTRAVRMRMPVCGWRCSSCRARNTGLKGPSGSR